ncbi:MAG: superoxide dismutase [Bdellovibrionota bacterium]
MEKSASTIESASTQYYSLPKLPFAYNALEPNISAETFEYHYGKHHKAYVDKLNKLIKGTEFEKLSIEEVIRTSDGALFNNAAQAWNHTFFWNCLSPDSKAPTSGSLFQAIETSFGSFEDFKAQFSKAAEEQFGTGWAWLLKTREGKLEIRAMEDADNPLLENSTPLLTCDVWEHAYYIDYRNERPKFVKNFWNVVNWDFVTAQFAKELH